MDRLEDSAPQQLGPSFLFEFVERDFVTFESHVAMVAPFVVPVVVRMGTTVRGLGTAFCISNIKDGPALFVTARHVVRELEGASGSSEPFVLIPRSRHDGDVPPNLLGGRITHVGVARTFSDIALLSIDLPVEVKEVPWWLPVDVGAPVVGEHCMALGYSGMMVGAPVSSDDSSVTQYWSQRLAASRTAIEEIHSVRRDVGLLDFPCFRVAGFFGPGMSGGPIISEAGNIIGVVSAGFAHESRTAYGALIAPLAEVVLELKVGQVTKAWRVADLMSRGIVVSGGAPAQVSRTADGVEVLWGAV